MTGCREGQSLSQQEGEHTSALSHIPALTRVLTVHSCTPALTHTRAFMHTVHSHTCLRAHTLILTHMQALISGSWLHFWRFNSPPPRLRLSRKHFSGPRITPGSLQSHRSWTPLGKVKIASRLWVEDRDTISLEEVRRGLDSSPHSTHRLTAPVSPDLGFSGGRTTDRQRPRGGIRRSRCWETAMGSRAPRERGLWIWGEESCRMGILYGTDLDPFLGCWGRSCRGKGLFKLCCPHPQPPPGRPAASV